MKHIFLALLLVGASYHLGIAQVSYIESSNISALCSQYKQQNKATSFTLGYRVQILSTPDRRKMEEVKEQFIRDYPEYVPVWTYEAPNYKLRVGAFKTKLETEGLKHILRKSYPSVFPVKDNKIRPIEYL